MRWYIVAAAILLPITALFALRPRESIAGDSGGERVAGTDVATRAVVSWARPLNASAPVWISAAATAGGAGAQVETHTFGVVIDGLPYDVAVQVAVGSDGGRWVLSDPSIVLNPDQAERADRTPLWPGTDRYTPGDAVTAAVEAWTDAYFSGSAQQLLNVTRDPTSGRSYLAVAGYTPEKVAITNGAVHPHRGVIVRAIITLHGNNDSEPNPVSFDVAFDVVVIEQTTATPVVVAWGPPGAGPQLEPYGNAVDGDIAAPTTSIVTTSTTTVPSAADSAGTAATASTRQPTTTPRQASTTTSDRVFDPFSPTTIDS